MRCRSPRPSPAPAAASTGDDDVHATAAQGVGSAGGALPHLDRIQRSFGHHDVSHVSAHTGPAADEAANNLGARAYTMGDQVVLGATADLHTEAHEAAHVVQQRGGVQLAGGVGAADDPHERHADEVADRVVRGESAVDLLDRYGGTSARPGAGGIQLERHAAPSSPASVAIVREVIRRGDVGTMRPLLRAMEQVAARRGEGAPALDPIVAVGGGDTYDLRLTPADSSELQTALRERLSALEGEARATALAAGQSGASVERQSRFAQDFNRVFADILPALRQSVPAADPDAPDPRSSFLTDAELEVMFSPGQRSKLQEYFADNHPIPDRLFNGDDHGGATAQQRIVLSNHILANGTYTPGSWAQRLYARYCGHWTQLVYNYAGVTQTGHGRGLLGNFDHDGNLVLGAGRTSAVEHGRTEIPEEEREGNRRFLRDAVSEEEFNAISPGDWLYIHTGVDTAGGDHSVVFSHWLAPLREENGLRFRRGVTYDQGHPEEGGRRHERYLGFDDAMFEGQPIRRVTRIEHPDPDARPPETVQDVIEDDLQQTPDDDLDEHIAALVGNGPAAQRNVRFLTGIERRYHGRINIEALKTHIRGANASLIARLDDRNGAAPGTEGAATDGQVALLTATNASDDLETLVRLNERLNVFVSYDEALATRDAAQDAEERDHEPEIRAHYEERMRLIAQIETIEGEMERADAVADLIPVVERARQSVRLARRRRDEVERARDRARVGTRRRQNLQARVDALQAVLDRLETNLRNLETRLGTESAAEEALRSTALRREPRSMRQRVNLLDQLRRQLEQNLAEEEDGYARTAHVLGRGDQATFRGSTSDARPSGAIEHVRPQPTPSEWQSMITPGLPGAAAEASAAARLSRRLRGGGRRRTGGR